jgi:hypothetical protein
MTILNEFLLDPTPFNASRLISMPSLYHVLKIEWASEGAYLWPILGVARWIHSRARHALQHLTDRGAELSMDPELVGERDRWQEVSLRPRRPRIVTKV